MFDINHIDTVNVNIPLPVAAMVAVCIWIATWSMKKKSLMSSEY
jgi:hypothetical protein